MSKINVVRDSIPFGKDKHGKLSKNLFVITKIDSFIDFLLFFLTCCFLCRFEDSKFSNWLIYTKANQSCDK